MKINKIIKILITSDLVYQIATGFVTPIFAVFLVESISAGSLRIIGIATAIHWLTKSTIRLPVAYFLDKKRGEFDDFYSMVGGFFVMSVCFFLYVFANTPTHIYIIQFLMGIGGAFAFTPWYGFFSRHIDRSHANVEWSITNAGAGFALAGAGYLTGIIADKYGFSPIFLIAGMLSLISTFLFLLVGKNIKLKKTDGFTLDNKPLK